MEQESDIQLIQDTLDGDNQAFNALVEKYQKSIHALAWRKIGDFHYAQEITQDTFLQAYRKLSTLRNPNLFAGWLYVIANRRCISWFKSQKPPMQSLEAMSVTEIERESYSQYESEQRDKDAREHNYERVKILLDKLPESERTVMTLYYLGDMTTREIGKFLGVSINTITSRLQRARQRLQTEQENLIQEVLSSTHVPEHIIQNIMQQVADINATPKPTTKPILPWIALGAVILFIALLFGTGNRYLTRFQRPYGFQAQSDSTTEIIDTNLRNQSRHAATPAQGNTIDSENAPTLLASTPSENTYTTSTSQWTQSKGLQGSHVFDLFATTTGNTYAVTSTGVYKLTEDATAWTHINNTIQINERASPIAEHANTLYLVTHDKIYTATSNADTFNPFCTRPTGRAAGIVITDSQEETHSQARPTIYLAIRDKGVFRSTDDGTHWQLLNIGLTDKRIYTIAAIENTIFAGTNDGLYRLNVDSWEPSRIRQLTPSKH